MGLPCLNAGVPKQNEDLDSILMDKDDNINIVDSDDDSDNCI